MNIAKRGALRRGIELGWFHGDWLLHDDTEPVAIDAQAGKGKLTRFLGVNLVSPRTGHFSKIITDPKDGELAWIAWKTLQKQGYRCLFLNPEKLYGYPSESYNINTTLLETARRPELRGIVDNVAYDCARFLIPIEPDSKNKWVGQGACALLAFYYSTTALFPSLGLPCTPGGAWDFFGRGREEIARDLIGWALDQNMALSAGMARLLASLTDSPDQWNAYASVFLERLQAFRPGSAARAATDKSTFDPAEMKRERTALFIIGSARSPSSRNFVGSMAAAVIERFADAHGQLRALVVGEEWGQLYVSNFYEILTLYRQGGVNFLGVFQNANAQIETRYGKEMARLWRKAVAHTIYRGLPDSDTLREIEHRSGKTSEFVRSYSVNHAQVNGAGDNWSEQARPLLQVEDIRRATGGERGLLESRDYGYFEVDMPNFWERPEMSGLLRNVQQRPDKYGWLGSLPSAKAPPLPNPEADSDIHAILNELRKRPDY
ncbi:type IV secretory system conjugative DNA transfer family protein [Sphingopyxis terrae]|uniref:type IV secretory system conjugative DNA transfer family protein n=1 Tax=Sphingopyxis terrae TaxID=33052 RepID=UPI001C2C0663|nr:TraM recognition domain-containing protein [Sphingopyxis terrae]QXF12344.1 type IV secretory system conjugative DNA transfer family protein [Sphingopyxis terrae subsp. terrae]